MLPSRAAETGKRVTADVMAPGNGDLADCRGHVVDRDLEEPLGNVLEALAADRLGHLLQPRARGFDVERLVAGGTEHGWEMPGIDPPEEQVAVGDRKRPAVAIAGRARVRAGRFRPHAKTHAVEAADRTATGRDGMDLHHRRANARACDQALVGKLELASIMRDVGRCPAHVEADQALALVGSAGRDHADHPARGSRQDRVLSAEGARFGEAAIRLHEMKVRIGTQPASNPIDVAPQYRRQIGIDYRRIAPPDQLDQGSDLMTDRDLREAEFARDVGQPLFVLGVFPTVHQDDRQGIDAGSPNFLKRASRAVLVEQDQHRAVDGNALIDLDHPIVEHRREEDMAREDVRPRLIADPQRVAEPTGDRQGHPFAFALEQRVGRDRRSHAHFGNAAAFLVEHAADRFERRVFVPARIFGQQLVDLEPTVGRAGDNVGEGAAAVDGKGPDGLHGIGL